jgi:hypothetical protein
VLAAIAGHKVALWAAVPVIPARVAVAQSPA